MAATTETVLGVFAHVDTTVRALEELRAKGYHDLTVYTPVPVHEIEDVLERDRPVSRVRLFTLLGSLAGLAAAGRRGRDPAGAARRGGEGAEPREGLAGVDRHRTRPLRDVLHAVPRPRGQGGGVGPGGDEVHSAARPHQRRSPAPADGRLL